jgi:hypothetical protein
MESLDISENDITSASLSDIMQAIESTRLNTIDVQFNDGVFNDEDATEHFVSALQHTKSSVQELPEIDEDHFRGLSAAMHTRIQNSLTRNQQLNHVHLLLAPPPQRPPQQQQL